MTFCNPSRTSSDTMNNRREISRLSEYTYMVVLVISCFTGINTTTCTDQTQLDNFYHVVPMCQEGTSYNRHLVIDSWGTGGPSVYSCTCTVTLYQKISPTTTVTVQEYPGVEPTSLCASKLRVTSTTSTGHTEASCIPIPATSADNFGTADMLTLTISRAENSTQWRSGHCILISSDYSINSEIIVTCDKGNMITNPQTAIPTSTEDTIPTTIKSRETTTPTQALGRTTTIQTRETTKPSQSIDTTTTIQLRETTTINNSGCSTQGQDACQQQGYTLSAVVVPLVVTILLITFSVVGHVFLYRRRLGLIKQPECSEAVTSQHATYDSLDLSKVEPPNVYADTSTRQIYVNTTIES